MFITQRQAPRHALRSRFNEAAPRWARKRLHARLDRTRQQQASMRPRHDGRGNAPRTPWQSPRPCRFNEAAPRWARKRRDDGLRGEPARLASMRPRHDGRGNRPEGAPRLQRCPVASMRPRHDGRGNSLAGRILSMGSSGFNEAAPRWARKLWQSRGPGRGWACFNEAAPRWARKP